MQATFTSGEPKPASPLPRRNGNGKSLASLVQIELLRLKAGEMNDYSVKGDIVLFQRMVSRAASRERITVHTRRISPGVVRVWRMS